MAAACVHPLPLYRPRDPQASDLWRLMDRHFETFQRVYDERFCAKYGYWRPIVERSVMAYLRCGDLHEGFARVRCGDCGHEMFVACSCKQRCTCPSCHQKRTLLTAIHVAEDVCAAVPHRQVVLTIPKRLRVHTRFDRKLLGKLCAAAWTCLRDEVRRLLGRDDVVPGMIAAIQTHGELLHWQPHIHALVTCGAFTAEGGFLEVPEFDMDRLREAWREAVFALYLADEKITPEVVENMRSWPHSGFSADQSVHLPAEPPQADVIEKILRHCGLWHSSRAPPADGDFVHDPDADGQAAPNEPRELTFVAEDGIWAEADAFARDAADDWYRQPAEDEPHELTFVDEDTFWNEF